MPSSESIEREVYIAAPRARVFALLTDLDQLRRWMPMASFEPTVGGSYEYVVGEWVAAGTILEIVEPSRLVYTWDWRNEPMGVATVVEFDLDEDGPDATVLRLRHTGIPSADLVDSHARGWDHVLPRLVIVAAGGDPGPADVLTAVFGSADA
jgi:uncharacterized protein YndB with AHSA1/START domain